MTIVRAFASGCSALTGVEAIANGVQAFRRPKVRNAQTTLVLMGSIAIVLFVGLVTLALVSRVHYAERACDLQGFTACATTPQRSLIAQIAAELIGRVRMTPTTTERTTPIRKGMTFVVSLMKLPS